MPWWIAPYGHPEKTARLESIKIGMKERAHKFAAGFLEVDELPVPTLPNTVLNPIILPSYKRTHMSDKWNKDGTPRE
ncbi:hypothetical protein [Desulfovibrio litoralis]|uniref:Uncharacterized protein n=1 Tax=Desulfovibrio litoralis DSM 11393 TaxID=1121455 RepID=A0A1M7T2I1_9BACT|nr:hypothetical protein [Desulfovibrio litoralis]SHN64980.1 hypothetical protein SAMN02745728_01480 [Desulfovibrio litoralis DSM 11393]